MESKKKPLIVEADTYAFTKKGNGLASFTRHDNTQQTVEVPFTMPGDKSSVRILSKRRGVYQGTLEQLITPSTERTTPRCVHFGSCGGCRWQHLTYEKQLQLKESAVRHHFVKVLTTGVDFRPILPCLPPWHYRNKMEFSFSSNKAKDQFLGMIMDSSNGKVFNLTECHLVNSWFAEGAKAVRHWWAESGLDAFHPFKNTGSLRTLTMREGMRSGDRMVILTVSGNAEYALKKHDLDAFVDCLKKSVEPEEGNLSVFLRIHQAVKGTPSSFFEMHLYGPDHLREVLHITYEAGTKSLPLAFKISPAAFFQPNTRQAEQLYSHALQIAEIPQDGLVYDLYCGTGTLGICAAKNAKRVVGIEIVPESALDAQENCQANGLTNVEIACGDVGTLLKERLEEKPDLVMVDPPRVGLDPQSIDCLLSLRPPKILYISCNPETQAANVETLVAGGYRLKTIQPVDQFPQTVHVENIALLERTFN
jgi:23S rRNA (uracil1939-C5)-methyltransferase